MTGLAAGPPFRPANIKPTMPFDVGCAPLMLSIGKVDVSPMTRQALSSAIAVPDVVFAGWPI